jgi:uncharacterized protein (DUF2147 family)
MRLQTWALETTALLAVGLLTAALLTAGAANAASAPVGVWLTDSGRGAVEIKECGDSLCGRAVWLRDKTDVKGCGKEIIGEVKHVGGGVWDNGWVYSPERKKKYDVELKQVSDDKLRVKGYAGSKFFSKTMIWTRAPADLERCDAVQEAAVVPPAPQPAPVAKEAAASEVKPAQDVAPSAPEAKPQAEATTPAPTPDAPAATQQAASEEPADTEADPLEELKNRFPALASFAEGLETSKSGKKCSMKVPYAGIVVHYDCNK